MARSFAYVLVAMLVCGAAIGVAANCKTDADCPSSYCMADHTPPTCHSCGDYCCLKTDDCTSKCGPDSYCMMYPGKKYPYWCHAQQCNITAAGQSVEDMVRVD
mmetsp:Transcript_19209/g.54043  ORF Transcript_19209/g.54043 Transcript_19209/m.54043 type:complete len:103 (+) Transcript_19209:2-310(+)